MTTKIFVSQIDSTQPDGTTAAANTIIVLGSNGPYWGDFGGGGNGYTGSVGYRGSAGYFGSIGYKGSKGDDGVYGAVGYRGSVGFSGSNGEVGFQGSAGTGTTGFTGSVGFGGSVGTIGFFGSLGFFGSTGYRGSSGFVGSDGYVGSVGYRGSVGEVGETSFTTLTDGPGALVANKVLVVNSSATGVILTSNIVLTSANVVSANITSLIVGTIASNVVFAGTKFDYDDKLIVDPVLKGYGETVNNIGNSTSTLTVNPKDGNIVRSVLNAGVVVFDITTTGLVSGPLYSITLFLKQDGTGSRIVDWTNLVLYWSTAEGISQVNGPTLSTSPYYTDVVTLSSFDGGATWFGSLAVKGFPTTV
jgi:hypothetical protein